MDITVLSRYILLTTHNTIKKNVKFFDNVCNTLNNISEEKNIISMRDFNTRQKTNKTEIADHLGPSKIYSALELNVMAGC